MSAKVTKLEAAHYLFLARSFTVVLGCFGFYWGFNELPVFWRQSPLERIAERIIAGDPFKAGVLTRQLPILEDIEQSGYCRPIALRSVAIFRVRALEAATLEAGANMRSTATAIRQSLFCSPADPFLWLVLYGLANDRNSVQPNDLKYLQMSYATGPNEGWIASKRNWLAFEKFDDLPPDLVQSSVDEFVGLVRSGFSERAAEILSGPAWNVRNLLLPRLKDVAERQGNALVYDLGKKRSSVAIPGK